MNQHQFHNALRKLANIEGRQIKWMTDVQQDNFFQNPHKFFISCDDDTATKLWEIMFPPPNSGAPDGVVVPFPGKWTRECRVAGVPPAAGGPAKLPDGAPFPIRQTVH